MKKKLWDVHIVVEADKAFRTKTVREMINEDLKSLYEESSVLEVKKLRVSRKKVKK